jgi:hypothetical protein
MYIQNCRDMIGKTFARPIRDLKKWDGIIQVGGLWGIWHGTFESNCEVCSTSPCYDHQTQEYLNCLLDFVSLQVMLAVSSK